VERRNKETRMLTRLASLGQARLDVSTTLKHKSTNISISGLIASLNVEEKVWAKDGRSKGMEGQTMSHGKGTSKQNNNKSEQCTNFKSVGTVDLKLTSGQIM
jgi:hypothetical protein